MSEDFSLEDVEGAVSEAASRVASLRHFLESAIWQEIYGTLKDQIDQRRDLVMEPLSTLESAIKSEFVKGEAFGLNVAKGMPQMLLESAEVDLERLQTQHKEMSNEAERVDGAGGSGSRIDNERDWHDRVEFDPGDGPGRG